MRKISDKIVNILLWPLKAAIRAMFRLGAAAKKATMRDILRKISRVGETVVKFIYLVGLSVENTVKNAVFGTGRLFIKTIKFIYRTGEVVIIYGSKTIDFIIKIVMIIPKSIVRDFSYWATAVSAAAVFAVILSSQFFSLALKVTVNGETAGYVANENAFSEVVGKVEDSLGNTIGENYVMASQPEYSFAIVNKDKLLETQIYDNVYNIVCEEIGEHYGLYVDGQLVAATEKESTLTNILDELKKPYATNKENESVEFVADVKVKKGIYAPSFFVTEDEIRAKFSSSTNPRYYTIQEDDYLSDISKATGLSKSQLYALNPELDERRLVPGKKLNISQPEVYLGIKIVKTINYTEEIDYETVQIKDSSLYKTQTKVKTAGRKGEKEIVAEVTYIDGAQVSKKIVSSKVTREPTTKEVYVGTKALPTTTSPLAGTGTFIRPISGGYTSCGFRGYYGHNGVDLTMSGAHGRPVYASASGTVIYAGWSGGYGKTVRIQHSNGYTTYYAHMSSIDVSTGQTVYQGQQVGRIGSTGNSTGPHLHFELRKNGTPLNPMKYIG